MGEKRLEDAWKPAVAPLERRTPIRRVRGAPQTRRFGNRRSTKEERRPAQDRRSFRPPFIHHRARTPRTSRDHSRRTLVPAKSRRQPGQRQPPPHPNHADAVAWPMRVKTSRRFATKDLRGFPKDERDNLCALHATRANFAHCSPNHYANPPSHYWPAPMFRHCGSTNHKMTAENASPNFSNRTLPSAKAWFEKPSV